jgi:predicted DNA-binding protein with PD1-like motif
MRQILHPGPVAPERVTAVASQPFPLHFTLEPGHMVDEAIAKGFAASGCVGGFVALQGGRYEPFRYVIPAASADADHVAWYSATFELVGPVEIARACAIVGRRDGKPFLHCHGIWNTTDGLRMGHLLAPGTRVAEVVHVTGIGSREVTFEARPDPETNFTLFEPTRVAGAAADLIGARVLLVKVRPNEDIILAIERVCARHGIGAANVYGIGSLNEVRFADGRRVESHATEILIQKGRAQSIDGCPRVRLDIDVVDMEGRIHSGEIVRGDNPVCVTFELVIEALAE